MRLKKFLYISILIIVVMLLLIQSSVFLYKLTNTRNNRDTVKDDNYKQIGKEEIEGADEEILVKAFEQSGASIMESNINAWAKISHVFMDEIELEELCRRINSELGFLDEYTTVEITGQPRESQATIKGLTKDNREVKITLQSNEFTEGHSATYLVVDVIEHLSYDTLYDTVLKVRRLFDSFSQIHEITISFTGEIDQKLDLQSMETLCENIFNALNADVIERYGDNNLISMTGYTDKIENSIIFGEKKINLNVALRYNTYEEKTFIWIATPIITKEY